MIIDVLVLIILVFSALIAFLRGFIREVLTIAGVLGGMVAAYYFAPHLQPHMRGWLGVDETVEPPQQLFGIVPYAMVSDALSYGAIFITVVIVLSIISHMLAETIKSIGLGAIDRTLGVFFGLARGVILLVLLYMPVHLFVDDETKAQWFTGSQSYFYLDGAAERATAFLPEEMLQRLQEQAEEQSEAAKDGAQGMLQKMDLLGNNAEKDEEQKPADNSTAPDPDAPAPQEPQNNNQGYGQQLRNEIDNLFKKKSEEPAKTP